MIPLRYREDEEEQMKGERLSFIIESAAELCIEMILIPERERERD